MAIFGKEGLEKAIFEHNFHFPKVGDPKLGIRNKHNLIMPCAKFWPISSTLLSFRLPHLKNLFSLKKTSKKKFR